MKTVFNVGKKGHFRGIYDPMLALKMQVIEIRKMVNIILVKKYIILNVKIFKIEIHIKT